MKQIIRQGDISLHKINELPVGLTKNKDNIIAYGEHTGHRHFFNSKQKLVHKDLKGKLYVELLEDTKLVHSGPDLKPVYNKQEAIQQDKHLTVTIPKGIYLVNNEMEYDPFDEQIKQVLD